MEHNTKGVGMKKWVTVGALALLIAAGFVYPAPGKTATTSYTVVEEYGTVTYKFVIDTDSNEAIGHYHWSGEAVKTPWVHVPVMTDFVIYTEYRDIDSSAKTFTADTIHVALETAPLHGLAHDSVSIATHRQKASIMWNFANGLSFTALTSQHFFPAGAFADTSFQTPGEAAAAKDTLDTGATSLKSMGFGDMQGGATPMMNLGLLRFSVCLDAADSLLDGRIRMNCYIVFRNPSPGRMRFSKTLQPGDLGGLYWSAIEPRSRIWYDPYHRAWAVKRGI